MVDRCCEQCWPALGSRAEREALTVFSVLGTTAACVALNVPQCFCLNAMFFTSADAPHIQTSAQKLQRCRQRKNADPAAAACAPQRQSRHGNNPAAADKPAKSAGRENARGWGQRLHSRRRGNAIADGGQQRRRCAPDLQIGHVVARVVEAIAGSHAAHRRRDQHRRPRSRHREHSYGLHP